MFGAVDPLEDRKINAIAPEWAEPAALESLRQWCREDRIRCPHCRAPVLIKAGEIKIRHFAHRSVADCPYADEDAEKLRGRQILYEWLVAKTGQEAVELEAKVDWMELPVPLDVLVSYEGRRYGYCFLHRNVREAGQRSAIRSAVTCASALGRPLHLVFSTQLLAPIEGDRGRVRLSPTLRELFVTSEYDGPHQEGGTLHFLDPESRLLTSLRGLSLYHAPQAFRFGKRWATPVSEVCLRPSNGEIVHPGEHEAWTAWREAERKRCADGPLLISWGASSRNDERVQCVEQNVPIRPNEATVAAEPVKPRPGSVAPCVLCGVLTHEDDYIVYDGKTMTCKCRECMIPPR